MAKLIIVEPPLIWRKGERLKIMLIKHAMVVLEQRQAVKIACRDKKIRVLHSGGPVVAKMAKELSAEVGGDRIWMKRHRDSIRHTEVMYSVVQAALANPLDAVVLIDQIANSAVLGRKLYPGEVAMVDEQGVVTMLISRSPD